MTVKKKENIKSLRKIQFSLIAVFLTFIILSVAILNNKGSFKAKNIYPKASDSRTIVKNVVYAKRETQPLPEVNLEDDAADDPAIWYNKKTPSQSIVFGSNKKAGILAYNLNGKQLQFVKYAKINNIDVRQDVKLGNNYFDILAGSNMSNKTIDLFFIDKVGKIESTPSYSIVLQDFKPYGFCLYKDKNENLNAFVNDKDGNVKQFFIDFNKSGRFTSKLVKKIKMNSRIEGMVADDVNKKIYIAEEEVGIHVFRAELKYDTIGSMLRGSSSAENHIEYDIEGLALLPPHYLVASNQGNFSYAIFDLQENNYVTSFKISNNTIDGVEETDGVEILSRNLSNNFPNGVFVVHDGFNLDNDERKSQNYKIVDLKALNDLLLDYN